MVCKIRLSLGLKFNPKTGPMTCTQNLYRRLGLSFFLSNRVVLNPQVLPQPENRKWKGSTKPASGGSQSTAALQRRGDSQSHSQPGQKKTATSGTSIFMN